MVTLSTAEAHGAFETVHAKTFVPTVSPVMVVVGDSELVITPKPETKDQLPIPEVGELAAIVTEPVLIQML